MPELLNETITVGLYTFELDEEGVSIADHSDEEGRQVAEEDASFVDLAPRNRRDANQLSMALRKASRRLEEIAHTLPAE